MHLDEKRELLEIAVDEAIVACGGTEREAIKVLIVASQFLEARIEELQPTCRKDMRAAIIMEGSAPIQDELDTVFLAGHTCMTGFSGEENRR